MKNINVVVLFGITALLMVLSTGCTSLTGKEVITELNPKFDPNVYRGAYTLYFVFWPRIDDFFHKEQRLPLTSRDQTSQCLFIDGVETKGFCFPPDLSRHFEPIFYMPRKFDVTVADAQSKEILLTVHYKRDIFAWNGKFAGCEEAIIEALRDAFAQARKNHQPKKVQPAAKTDAEQRKL